MSITCGCGNPLGSVSSYEAEAPAAVKAGGNQKCFVFCARCASGWVIQNGTMRLMVPGDSSGLTADQMRGLMETKLRTIEDVLHRAGEEGLAAAGTACPDYEDTDEWAVTFFESWMCSMAFEIGLLGDSEQSQRTQRAFLKNAVELGPNGAKANAFRMLGETQFRARGSSLIASYDQMRTALGIMGAIEDMVGLSSVTGPPVAHAGVQRERTPVAHRAPRGRRRLH